MLKIHYGPMEGAIYNTALYFKNSYYDDWIVDPLAKRIIKSVDRAEVLGPNAIQSRVMGVVPPTGLSGGTKTLLLVHNEPDKIFNCSTCGDNCAFWLLKIARLHEEDIMVNLLHLMDFGRGKFTVQIENTGEIVHSMEELVEPAGLLLSGDL